MRNHHHSTHHAARSVCTGARKAPDVRTFANRASAVSAAAVAVLSLWGCAGLHHNEVTRVTASIPLPEDALLKPASAPGCAADATRAAAIDPKRSGEAAVDAMLAERIRLEYERDCYKRAEARLRERYRQLQLASRATSQAVKRLHLSDTN